MADWIPTSEAAALSGYTLRHVRLLITGGQVKGQRFGNVWQVSRRSLLAYMKRAEKCRGETRAQNGRLTACRHAGIISPRGYFIPISGPGKCYSTSPALATAGQRRASHDQRHCNTPQRSTAPYRSSRTIRPGRQHCRSAA